MQVHALCFHRVQTHLTVHQRTNPWSFQVRFLHCQKLSARILIKQLLLFPLPEKKYETIFKQRGNYLQIRHSKQPSISLHRAQSSKFSSFSQCVMLRELEFCLFTMHQSKESILSVTRKGVYLNMYFQFSILKLNIFCYPDLNYCQLSLISATNMHHSHWFGELSFESVPSDPLNPTLAHLCPCPSSGWSSYQPNEFKVRYTMDCLCYYLKGFNFFFLTQHEYALWTQRREVLVLITMTEFPEKTNAWTRS